MIKAVIFDFDKTLYSGISWKKWNDFAIDALSNAVKSPEKLAELVEKYALKTDASQLVLADICGKEGINFRKVRRYLKMHICPLQAKEGKKLATISNEFLMGLSKKISSLLTFIIRKETYKILCEKIWNFA